MDGERNVVLGTRHTKLKNYALQETFHCFGFQSAAKKTSQCGPDFKNQNCNVSSTESEENKW